MRTPDGYIKFGPQPPRIRLVLAGEVIADSRNAVCLSEGDYPPVYYIPRADVRMDLLQPTTHRSHCPHKGDASYWTIKLDDRELVNAVWSYETPFVQVAAIAGHLAFYVSKLDGCYIGEGDLAA